MPSPSCDALSESDRESPACGGRRAAAQRVSSRDCGGDLLLPRKSNRLSTVLAAADRQSARSTLELIGLLTVRLHNLLSFSEHELVALLWQRQRELAAVHFKSTFCWIILETEMMRVHGRARGRKRYNLVLLVCTRIKSRSTRTKYQGACKYIIL